MTMGIQGKQHIQINTKKEGVIYTPQISLYMFIHQQIGKGQEYQSQQA